MRLLVVDDEPTLLFAISAYLGGTRWTVDCAAELRAARALLAGIDYDVVITDLRLSDAQRPEGLEVISLARERSADIPLVVLTAFETDEMRHELERLGVSAVLCKPQPLSALAVLIDALTASRNRPHTSEDP
jgi:DNA-binding response OmpR family regulator